jgi:hypothetical protein
MTVCRDLTCRFTEKIDFFRSPEECQEWSYISHDSHSKEQQFDLLSLSIGIVNTEIHHISSFVEVSSIATDQKKDQGNSGISHCP